MELGRNVRSASVGEHDLDALRYAVAPAVEKLAKQSHPVSGLPKAACKRSVLDEREVHVHAVGSLVRLRRRARLDVVHVAAREQLRATRAANRRMGEETCGDGALIRKQLARSAHRRRRCRVARKTTRKFLVVSEEKHDRVTLRRRREYLALSWHSLQARVCPGATRLNQLLRRLALRLGPRRARCLGARDEDVNADHSDYQRAAQPATMARRALGMQGLHRPIWRQPAR
eukprot:3566473-Prymnesium_polylepis.4